MFKNPLYVHGDEVVSVPSHLNFGQDIVTTMWNHGDSPALINGLTHERLTYRDIVKDAMSLAVSLTRIGVKRGDVIAICSENRQEYWSTFFGICCTGATFTPTNWAYTKDELAHVLSISKPKMIFCSELAYKTHEQTLRSLPFMEKIILFGANRQPNTLSYNDLAKDNANITLENFKTVDVEGQTDIAVILYSSGTTGLPKGVLLTHLNVLTISNMTSSLDPSQSSLTITPWYHTMGLMGNLRIFACGSFFVYLPKFECDLYLRTIERYRIVQIVVAPTVLVALCKAQTNYDVSSVKLVYSGAAPLRSDTIRAVKDRFPNVSTVFQGYGMTEATLSVTRDTYDKVHLVKIGSVGRAVSCIVKIVDIENKTPLGPNQPGEIYIKGPSIMKGYVGKDKGEDFDDEGFFKTGDIGYYDDDKCFFIVDRLKELIKFKGYQVPPAEIEAVLLQHPNIRDAGVIGIPHDYAGEVPRAYVVVQPEADLTEEEIKNLVAEKLSNPKHLRGGVQFVNEIPRNPSGKILRRKLKEMTQIKNEAKSKL